MPSCNKITNVGQVIEGATHKGLFRRLAEKIGLLPKEVAEYRGKSLSEMAEITSQKDTFSKVEQIKSLKEDTKKQIDKLRETYNNEYKILKAKKDARIKELEGKKAVLRKQIKEIDEYYNFPNELTKNLEKEIETLKQKLNEKTRENATVDADKKQFIENECKYLSREIKEKEFQLNDLRNRIAQRHQKQKEKDTYNKELREIDKKIREILENFDYKESKLWETVSSKKVQIIDIANKKLISMGEKSLIPHKSGLYL